MKRFEKKFDKAFSHTSYEEEFVQEGTSNDETSIHHKTKETARKDSILPMLYILKVVDMIRDQGLAKSKNGLLYGKQVFDRNPGLKTFGYSVGLLSIVPVGIFITVFMASLCITVFTAAIGVFFVQSGVFLVGMGVLAPVEIGVLLLAGSFTYLLKVAGNEKLITLPERVYKKYENKLILNSEKDI
jgi:hypothetical protein